MTNYIINDKLTVLGDITITGLTIRVLSENGLNKVENLDTYVPISGTVDDLVVENLVLCEYKNCELLISGCTSCIDTITYE